MGAGRHISGLEGNVGERGIDGTRQKISPICVFYIGGRPVFYRLRGQRGERGRRVDPTGDGRM